MLPVSVEIRSGRLSVPALGVDLTRRGTLAGLVGLALSAGVPGASAWAQSSLAGAASFMRRVGDELAAIVGGDGSKAEKRQKLQSLIDRAVAVDEIARFCLGRFWRDATPGQQREYLQLFHSVLVREVVVRLGDYQQEVVHITVGDPERNGDDTNVPSVVKRAGNPPVQVKWVLQDDSEGFRIVDMLAEGVSMRLTVRNDYDSFITSHDDNISELLSALRRQAAS